MIYTVAVLCVIGIAAGQILFKLSAKSLHKTGSFFHMETAGILCSSFVLYAFMTILWVWVLQKIELGRAYPLMALAFVFVPIGSYFFLGERFSFQYIVGVGLILVGIIISVRG